jgi:hypothetical protein
MLRDPSDSEFTITGCIFYLLPTSLARLKHFNTYVYPWVEASDYDYLLVMWKISCFKVMTNYVHSNVKTHLYRLLEDIVTAPSRSSLRPTSLAPRRV